MIPAVRSFSAALLLVSSLAAKASAENWPQWRGPRGDGVSSEQDVPTRWSKSQNVAWRRELPGPAGSTPVVWDKHIFLTSADGNDLVLVALSTSGDMLWKRTICSGNKRVRGDEGNYASATPSTDGKHVWALMGTGHLACFDFKGNPAWKVDLQERYGKFDIAFGYTATPILDRGRIYLQIIHGDGDPKTQESRVVCLDAASGNEVWNQPRNGDARNECEHSYASPALYRDDQREFLLSHGADYLIAHSLDDGKEVWRCSGLNPRGRYHPTLRFVASPLASDGIIVVPTAKRQAVFGLRPDGKGDIAGTSSILWRLPDKTPDVPSPLYHDGLVYLCRENGNLICLEAKTGEEIYEKRTVGDRHRASPVYADGKIYLTSRRGVVTVVKAGREFEILSKNDLGESTSASPAISNGTIYVRTFDALYAIRE